MQLQDITVSLELAKQLKKVGYPQESLFYWVKMKVVESRGNYSEKIVWQVCKLIDGSEYVLIDNYIYVAPGYDSELCNPLEVIAAPTASELGERLPVELKSGRYIIERGEDYFELRFYKDAEQDLDGLYDWHDELYTEADARAKMWLYLKEHNLLD